MESSSTTSKKKIEAIQTTIQQLIESKQSASTNTTHLIHTDDEHQLLSILLSQLESLKAAGEVVDPSEQSGEPKEELPREPGEVEINETEISKLNSSTGTEKVIKELKKLEKQNRTTHWLLSALILVTVAWQLSEVSLLLKMRDGLSHPFKSLRSMVAGMVKRPKLNEVGVDQSLLPSKKNGDEE